MATWDVPGTTGRPVFADVLDLMLLGTGVGDVFTAGKGTGPEYGPTGTDNGGGAIDVYRLVLFLVSLLIVPAFYVVSGLT